MLGHRAGCQACFIRHFSKYFPSQSTGKSQPSRYCIHSKISAYNYDAVHLFRVKNWPFLGLQTCNFREIYSKPLHISVNRLQFKHFFIFWDVLTEQIFGGNIYCHSFFFFLQRSKFNVADCRLATVNQEMCKKKAELQNSANLEFSNVDMLSLLCFEKKKELIK